MIKQTLMMFAVVETAFDKTTAELEDIIADWNLRFKENLVILFVNTFALSVEKEFLNGNIFADSLRIKTAEQWNAFAENIRTSKSINSHIHDILWYT